MRRPEDQSNEVLKTLSELEDTRDLSRETAQDALSIVIDAINSTVGGLIITDLSGTIRFANPSFCRMFDYTSLSFLLNEAFCDIYLANAFNFQGKSEFMNRCWVYTLTGSKSRKRSRTA